MNEQHFGPHYAVYARLEHLYVTAIGPYHQNPNKSAAVNPASGAIVVDTYGPFGDLPSDRLPPIPPSAKDAFDQARKFEALGFAGFIHSWYRIRNRDRQGAWQRPISTRRRKIASRSILACAFPASFAEKLGVPYSGDVEADVQKQGALSMPELAATPTHTDGFPESPRALNNSY